MDTRRELELALRHWLHDHHGIIGHREAVRLGATEEVIRAKLARGEWVRVYRGVYRDTVVPRTHAQDLRAVCVLTHGRAVASHASAAWLWGLLARPPDKPELTVARAFQHGRTVRGILVHQSIVLDWTRVRTRDTIPVTDPLRTLVDLGGSVPAEELTAAVDAGLATRLVSVDGLVAELARLGRGRRPGARSLRRMLAERALVGVPQASVLEVKALAMFQRAGLPVPRIEYRVGQDGEYRLDFAYPVIKFAVEVDGYAWHSSPEQFQHDRARRNQLQRRGWVVLVYTWRDIVSEPVRVAQEIAWQYHSLMTADERNKATGSPK
ncbi:MAG: DUF559 domain-containing protein [Actinomycetota bacterium]|nr:DUF559 domain-containing protein [Actinomycetota bacterium]